MADNTARADLVMFRRGWLTHPTSNEMNTRLIAVAKIVDFVG